VQLAERIGSFDLVYCAPQRAARDTADVMFKTAMIAPELRDIDYGRWSGRLVREVVLEDDIALHSWVGGARPAWRKPAGFDRPDYEMAGRKNGRGGEHGGRCFSCRFASRRDFCVECATSVSSG
jgi:broad specificity phosphatase PhoE